MLSMISLYRVMYLWTQKTCCCAYRRSGLVLRNYYGSGSGPIWLEQLDCFENELTIAECGHRGWGVHEDCNHSEDVSIICDNSK